MSITFSAEYRKSDLAGWKIVCVDDVQRDERTWAPAQYESDVVPAVVVHATTCENEDCRAYGVYATAIDSADSGAELSINTTNLNGAHLLSLLGLVWDGDGGSLDALDFKGRVLVAMGTYTDIGELATTSRSVNGMQWIECGRSADYSDRRLVELLDLAEFCLKAGRAISWC